MVVPNLAYSAGLLISNIVAVIPLMTIWGSPNRVGVVVLHLFKDSIAFVDMLRETLHLLCNIFVQFF